VPYIPFKSNSRATGKSDAWRRLWHMFEASNDQFLAHYHKRSGAATSRARSRWSSASSARRCVPRRYRRRSTRCSSSASATTSASSCTRSTS
jgi:hypothetical protein